MSVTPRDYITVELFLLPAGGFILDQSRLDVDRLADERTWIDVTCQIVSITASSAGVAQSASTEIDAGMLHVTVRNDLNPLENYQVHPGTPVRVIDSRGFPGRPLWLGELDDINISYDRAGDEYTVTLTATDIIRRMKAINIRGDLGSTSETSTRFGAFARINSVLSRAGLPGATAHGTVGSWIPSTPRFPAAMWTRFGSPPAGVTQRALVVDEYMVSVEDNSIDSDNEVQLQDRSRGIQLTHDGFVAGHVYRFTAFIQNTQAARLALDESDESYKFAAWIDGLDADTGAIPLRIHGAQPWTALELTFRATSQTHTIRIGRDFTGFIGGQGTGNRTPERYAVLDASLERWSAQDRGIRTELPVQPVAYDSTAFNHVVLACNSSGWRFAPDYREGGLELRHDGYAQPTIFAEFSDDHSRAGSPAVPTNHICIHDAVEGYDTASTVNVLTVDNHGRTPSAEVAGGWVVRDDDRELAETWSVQRFLDRRQSIGTQLPPALIPDRAAWIFDDLARPEYNVRSVTVNGLRPNQEHYDGRATTIRPLDQVHVHRKGDTSLYQVTGRTDTIRPDSHRITFQLRKVTL